MLGNIIGGFIVILVGRLKKLCPLEKEFFNAQPEYRLKPRDGQDRSVNVFSNARETDKAYFTFSLEDESKIYSPNSNYNLK